MAVADKPMDIWEYLLLLLVFGIVTCTYIINRDLVKQDELNTIATMWVHDIYDGRDTEVKCDTSDPDGDGLQFCVVDYFENGRHRSDLIQCAVKFSREPRCEISADYH